MPLEIGSEFMARHEVCDRYDAKSVQFAIPAVIAIFIS